VKFLLPKNTRGSFSLRDALFTVIVVVILIVVLAPARVRDHPTLSCSSRMKQIGLAFQIWAGDNDGHFPMAAYTNAIGDPAFTNSADAFRYFQAMSNEISSPKILICPADKERTAATNFTSDLNSTRISYFVGLNADEAFPQSFLAGDRNLTNGRPLKHGVLALTPDQPAGWTEKIHNQAGNVALADGSVQQFTSSAVNQFVRDAKNLTNYLLMP
jgi:prepilin-type processing-associated H-X9-DG protein